MKSNLRFHLALLLLLAFLLRLGAAAYWQRTAEAEGVLFRLGDSQGYWTLAGQIARGLPYQYGSTESRIFRAPLYPILIAPLTLIANEANGIWWTRVLGCGLGTLAVAFVGLLGKRIGGTRAGMSAVALAAIYPSAVGMSVVVLSEALFLPLMMAHLLLWQSAWRAFSDNRLYSYATLGGCAAGAAVLTRPSWLLFVPFVLAVGLVFGGERKRHVSIFVCTLLGLSIAMLPWWIRNARITGRFVPTTLQVGPSLYDGLHEGASGASDEGMAFMEKIIDDQVREDQLNPGPLVSTLEYRIHARAQSAALQWARDNPGEAVQLAGRKFLRIWSLWPDGGDVSSNAIRLAITLSSFGVLLLAIYASRVLIQPMSWLSGICWLPSIYFTLLHMVFVGSIRYREPAILVLVALAGCAIAKLVPIVESKE